jgi:DNA-binding NtrC family response regulator
MDKIECVQTKAKTVLLVEDDPAHAELIGLSFEPRDDLELVLASSLEEARGRLAAGAPDLLIVDSLLPDGRGVDLLEVRPRDAAYPIILLTSHADAAMEAEAMAAGVTRYVVKSDVTLLEMPEIVDQALRESGVDSRAAGE